MRRRDLIAGLAATAASLPLAARAQQKAMTVIGFLGSTSPGPYAPLVAAFRQGLSETGYVEGQNLRVEYRWAEGHDDRLPAMARDLVARKVDLIAASGSNLSALEAKAETSTIPIVFASDADPVADRLVDSLARPGGNVTGATFIAIDLVPKLLDLLSELVPKAAEIALLVNLSGSNAARVLRDTLDAADAAGVRLNIMRAPTESEIDFAFASLVQTRLDALVIGTEYGRHEQFVALASRLAVPAIYDTREAAASGGLISYGPRFTATYRQAGIYAGRILKGEKPADLPVQQPTKFELVINLKTAKALGLTVPQSLLARADEVIE